MGSNNADRVLFWLDASSLKHAVIVTRRPGAYVYAMQSYELWAKVKQSKRQSV